MEAPRLIDIQRWMQWIITDPRGVRGALEGRSTVTPLRPEPAPRCVTSVVDQPPLDRFDRIDIYAEGYLFRLYDALVDDFKTTARLIGKEIFLELISDYLAVHPSVFTNV